MAPPLRTLKKQKPLSSDLGRKGLITLRGSTQFVICAHHKLFRLPDKLPGSASNQKMQ
jgi:hypothetical protein